MSFQAMTWAVEQVLPSNQKIVLLMLANRTNHDTGRCDPSHKRLAFECGMGVSTLKRMITELEKGGYLTVEAKKVGDVNLPNQYVLHLGKKGVGPNRADPNSANGVTEDEPDGDEFQDGRVGSNRTDPPSDQADPSPNRAEGVGPDRATNQESFKPGREPKDSCPPIDGPVSGDDFKKLAKPIQARLIEDVFAHWQNVMASPRSRLDEKRRKVLLKALGEYGLQDTLNAITGCSRSNFHMGRNDDGSPNPGATKYNDVEQIFRDASKTERFLGLFENPLAFSRSGTSSSERFDPRAHMYGTVMGGSHGAGNRDYIDGSAQRLD